MTPPFAAAQRTNWAWTRAGLAFIGMSLTVMSDSLTKTSAFYALFFLLVGLVLSLIAAARFLVTFRDLETGKFRVLNRLILATSVVTFIGHLVILLMMAILP